MLVPALPAVLVGKEDYIGASAGGADDAIPPPARHNVFAAVVRIREVLDCFLEAGGFHEFMVPDFTRLVK
jgi:hypothetical protein